MLFTSLAAALAVVIHVQSAVGHPHQLHPIHANKVRMLQWDFRNADHRVCRACARRRLSTHPAFTFSRRTPHLLPPHFNTKGGLSTRM
jgi:hypothetical protein